jgi:hypothetical protein
MGLRTIPTATLTQGYVNQGWYNGRKATTVRQRCNLVHGSAFFTLNYALPPRSRLVWAEVLTQTTVAATGNDGTSTANCYALVVSPATANATAALTQPQTATMSNAPGGTSGYLALITPGLTTDATNQTRSIPLVFGTTATNQVINTNTSAAALITLQPAFTNSNRLYASGTSGFVFGTSTASTTTNTAGGGIVDVTLYIEEYDQAPYA